GEGLLRRPVRRVDPARPTRARIQPRRPCPPRCEPAGWRLRRRRARPPVDAGPGGGGGERRPRRDPDVAPGVIRDPVAPPAVLISRLARRHDLHWRLHVPDGVPNRRLPRLELRPHDLPLLPGGGVGVGRTAPTPGNGPGTG